MKKHAFALAVLAGFAGVASAQSSVTVFGVVDVNGRYVKNGDIDQYQLSTDGLNSSRLGFRGVEDLGGGLRAGFWLEAALNPDTGTINSSGKFWHRRTTVSLESNSFGEIRLGRDFVPTYTAIADFDVFGDNGIGKYSNLQFNLGGTVNTLTRGDNQAQYFLPKTLGGVYGSVSLAAGEGNVGDKYVGGRVGYAAGPVNVTLAYSETQANAADDQFKLGVIGASWDFGFLKLAGSASQSKYIGREERIYLIGASAPFGPFVLRASYGMADLSGGTAATRTRDDDDADLFAIGGVYNLSKRTALYTTVSRISNDGVQNRVVASSNIAAPVGGNSTGFELGLRHSF
ncbi:MAG TPA: porin [Rhizobacter sp.]|nr:porin [Rhizobacter sp.]